MSILEVQATTKGNEWWIRCPECKTRFELDECSAPGGMVHNVEFCPECGIEILVIPAEENIKFQ